MSTVSEPACYAILKKEGKILFVLREHTGYMDGYYSLPAGRVEAGETYMQGTIREAAEEVGVQIQPTDMQHIYTAHRYTKGQAVPARTDMYFEVSTWSGEPKNMEPERHSDIAWLSADELPETIMDYQRSALLSMQSGQTYGEFGWNIEK